MPAPIYNIANKYDIFVCVSIDYKNKTDYCDLLYNSITKQKPEKSSSFALAGFGRTKSRENARPREQY